MTLDDAILNWLQIKHVATNRPDDLAAQETLQFFTEILVDDFKLKDIIEHEADGVYIIQFIQDEQKIEKKYPLEVVRQLLLDIEGEARYQQ